MLMEKLCNHFAPNVKDTPLSFSPQPKTTSSGQTTKRSQRKPLIWYISCLHNLLNPLHRLTIW